MNEKRGFIESMLQGANTMTEACPKFGISRKTGYKWCLGFERTA